MKKLLKFNEDYADEHNVPALACFTEEQFEDWCNQSIGKINVNYEEELIAYNKIKQEYSDFAKAVNEKGLWNKPQNTYTAEEKEWLQLNRKSYPTQQPPKKGRSYLRAWLGNNGECFEEDYDEYNFGRDLITAEIVKVFDVSEEFYNTFHHANLSGISLCNVFDEMYVRE